MPNIESLIRQINREIVPLFEERLRAQLATKDREWLIEQIVRLTLDAHSLQEMDRKLLQEAKLKKRQERIARLRELRLDRDHLTRFLQQYAPYDRTTLIRDNYLRADAPPKGTELISATFRTPKGNELLQYAKDLLFGDETTNTTFERTQRELLTLTMPRDNADTLDFMKATTELSALGTWQDPERVSNDVRADNVLLEVEYGEIDGELIGSGIVRTLSLINSLEVNEQVLYARMINIEETTLIQ